jgi:death-on-curing protein
MQYPGLLEKMAVYLRNIIGDHPFSDGNKRTAVTVCGIFLLRNSVKLTATPQGLEDFVVRVATEHLEAPTIAAWFETHCK